MATVNLTNPLFSDEAKARAYLEAQRWPDGVTCPFCDKRDAVKALDSKAHGPGWYHCNTCRKLFTVRVRSVMERSHIPLTKWALVFHLMAASKKGVSAKQVQRMLGFKSYKTAWFMCHRIRTAMDQSESGPIGGDEKIIEADETYVHGKAANLRKGKPLSKKKPVVALIERHGGARARAVPDVTGKNVREVLTTQSSKDSYLMTDEASVYLKLGKEFYSHSMVHHAKRQYTRLGGFVHTNTAESFFALMKRGIMGSFHSVSERHLQLYANEFAFRWSNRSKLGIEDTERASRIIKGAINKRLTYRKADRQEVASK